MSLVLLKGRYLGNVFRLGGTCDWEKADIDQYADQITDFSLKIVELLSQTEESKLKNLTEEMLNTVLPTHLGYFQSKIGKSEKYYLVGDRLTWVDLVKFIFAKKLLKQSSSSLAFLF